MSIIRPLTLLLLCCQACFATSTSTPVNPTPVAPIAQPVTPLPTQEHPLETHQTPIPSSVEMTDSYQHAFIRMLLSLLGLLVLVFGTFWFLKRMGKGKLRFGSNRSIQILEKRPLSAKTVLYVIEVEGKQVLISESQLEVRALTTLEPKIDTED